MMPFCDNKLSKLIQQKQLRSFIRVEVNLFSEQIRVRSVAFQNFRGI